ncbi:hypothetical protein ES695_16020 [Candidatus Atribacteria bacterium 1244-E10-H5-B2]|nr:MAG: hypothetical protein ES695_16020 [Candidatus Atribacteria bacterium 1244-E10-H5-B2]
MKVRDRLLNKREYKGQLTVVADKMCPCRICYNPHDCGFRGSDGKWITVMRCLTNHNNGCPHDIIKRLPKPIHVIRAKAGGKGQTRICLRCGQRVVIGEVGFITFEVYQKKLGGGKIMFSSIKAYYEQVKRNSEYDEFSKKLKKNIEKLVMIDKKYSWEDEADINFRKTVVKVNEK